MFIITKFAMGIDVNLKKILFSEKHQIIFLPKSNSFLTKTSFIFW